MVDGLVNELLRQRAAARERKDFATADAIRSSLTALGVEVSDTPTGTRWSLHADLSAPAVPEHDRMLTTRRRGVGEMPGNSQRKGAVRRKGRGNTAGSGGRVRRGLEGKGPTPKAEDRPYHVAYRAKKAAAPSRTLPFIGCRGPAVPDQARSGW